VSVSAAICEVPILEQPYIGSQFTADDVRLKGSSKGDSRAARRNGVHMMLPIRQAEFIEPENGAASLYELDQQTSISEWKLLSRATGPSPRQGNLRNFVNSAVIDSNCFAERSETHEISGLGARAFNGRQPLLQLVLVASRYHSHFRDGDM
jgi:hypothetical protein